MRWYLTFLGVAAAAAAAACCRVYRHSTGDRDVRAYEPLPTSCRACSHLDRAGAAFFSLLGLCSVGPVGKAVRCAERCSGLARLQTNKEEEKALFSFFAWLSSNRVERCLPDLSACALARPRGEKRLAPTRKLLTDLSTMSSTLLSRCFFLSFFFFWFGVNVTV